MRKVNILGVLVILSLLLGFSSISFAGVGHCEATAINEYQKSRLSQDGCIKLGKMVLGDAYNGISGENIYLEKCTVKSACGQLYGKFHPGIDFRAATGTKVYSPIDGKVVGIDAANGTVAVQKTGSATKVLFGHLSKSAVVVGTNVTVGCLIGLSGNKSAYFNNMPSHLHIEARTSANGTKMNGYFSTRASSGDTKDPALIPPDFIEVRSTKKCQ
jgi:hypothetical protein